MSVGEVSDRTERPPYVTFETRAMHDVKASNEQGHYVAVDVDYVLVTPPYSKDCFEDKVENWFTKQDVNARNGRQKLEWVEAWKKSYELYKQGLEIPLDGTPIRGWGALSPAQEKMILQAGIRTIEDLAACNDEGRRRLGMGGQDLVNKAKSWLNSVNDHGKVALQNAALEKANEQLKLTVESLEEKVELLARQVQGQSNQAHEAPQIVPRETITAADILDDAESLSREDVLGEEAAAAAKERTLELMERGEIKRRHKRTELNLLYQKKFGKPPHHRMKESTIRAKLEE